MNEKWLWLPDFASDLGLWEDDLVGVAPAADHVFVPYETMANSLDDLYGFAGAWHRAGEIRRDPAFP